MTRHVIRMQSIVTYVREVSEQQTFFGENTEVFDLLLPVVALKLQYSSSFFPAKFAGLTNSFDMYML